MDTLEGYISLAVPRESSTLVVILIILPHHSFLHCQFQIFFNFLTYVYPRTQFDPLFLLYFMVLTQGSLKLDV